MDTPNEYEDFECSERMGNMKMVIAIVAVLAVVGIVWMKRRNARPESSIDKVMHTIRNSHMPDRTRKSVISALDETKVGITHLRDSAEKMAKRAS